MVKQSASYIVVVTGAAGPISTRAYGPFATQEAAWKWANGKYSRKDYLLSVIHLFPWDTK